MQYLKTSVGRIIECQDDEVEDWLFKYPNTEIITKDDAYIFLFIKISYRMGAKFSNYNHIDLQSDLLYMLLKKYKQKGLFAPDKSFDDNARIWWSVAKKTCYYLIREHKRKVRFEDLTDTFPENSLISDYYEIEHLDICKAIIEYISKLCASDIYAEQQMGLYGYIKLKNMTDKHASVILEVGMPRIYEIKKALKARLLKEFGDLL